MVPDRQKVRMDGRTEWTGGRTDGRTTSKLYPSDDFVGGSRLISPLVAAFEPRCEKHVKNKCAYQPAHPHSLISTFVIYTLWKLLLLNEKHAKNQYSNSVAGLYS